MSARAAPPIEKPRAHTRLEIGGPDDRLLDRELLDRGPAGPGCPDVDEVVPAVRSTGGTGNTAVRAAAESLGVDPRLVRIAIDYAAEHLEEIEARLDANDEAVDRVRRLDAARSSVFNG